MNNYLAMNICEAIMPIKDDSVNVTLDSKRYIYSVDTDSCVVTREYVSEYIKLADRDDNFETIDYEDIYDNLDDYEYPYNHINRSDL